MITDTLYYAVSSLLVIGIMSGIFFMSKVKTAVTGNRLSAVCTGLAILITLLRYDIISIGIGFIAAPVIIGTIFGLIWARRIRMIAMPQFIAVLNGFGGMASALVGAITLFEGRGTSAFNIVTAGLAISVGTITLTGSLVAAGKLSGLVNQRPVVWKGHRTISAVTLILALALSVFTLYDGFPVWITVIACFAASGFFGIAFAVRIGGADMPITISLLNSLSGIAVAIAGMTTGDPLLVSSGGIVGAAGFILTQMMCRAMNRKLQDIIFGRTTVAANAAKAGATVSLNTGAAQDVAQDAAPITNAPAAEAATVVQIDPMESAAAILRTAKRVIIVPGYGMALAQAQSRVRELADRLEEGNAKVDFAIHPVAGRMPGHMNVLLAEVDIAYEKLREMDDINPEFRDCDAAIVIGANDVINPAARDAPGTPIYGMPVLSVDEARHIIICNYDLKPGYSGVENQLYKSSKAILLLGDAAETMRKLVESLGKKL